MYQTETTIKKHHYRFLNAKGYKASLLLFSVGIIALVTSIFVTILKSSFFFLIVGSIALVLIDAYIIFLNYKAEKNTVGMVLKYTFKENEFDVCTSQGTSTILYSGIVNFKEDEKTMLLYLSKNQAYVVDKDNIDQDFIDFIKEKTSKKED